MNSLVAILLVVVASTNAGFLSGGLYTNYAYPSALSYGYAAPAYYYAPTATVVKAAPLVAPVVKTVATPVIATPVVKTVAAPVISAPVVKTVVASAPVTTVVRSIAVASPVVHAPVYKTVAAAPLISSYTYPTYAYGYGSYLLKK